MVVRGQLKETYILSKISPSVVNATSYATAHGFQRYLPRLFRGLSSKIEPQLSRHWYPSANTHPNFVSKSHSWAISHVSSVDAKENIVYTGSDVSIDGKNDSYANSNNFFPSTIPESATSYSDSNVTIAKVLPSTSETPLVPIIICAISLMIMMSVIIYFLCNCIYKRRKRRNQLATMTPKTSDPRMAGVRADQPIQFVVPTTIVINELNEDSLSDTDYSSGGPRQLPVLLDRRRKRPFSGFHISPSDLQRGLYEGVAAKLGSNAFYGDLGKIGFSLHYNIQKSQLYVKIIGATNLPCLFFKTTGNPCAKVVMMPDRIPKYVTKVQRNTQNPVFNETFVFPVMQRDLNNKKLKMSVWDYDKFSRKLLIGQIVYAIKDSELMHCLNLDSTTGDIWIDLKQDIDMHQKGNTELLFSLCYNPEIFALTVCILKLRGLDIGEKERETSVYVKVTLYVRRKMMKTKKTSFKRKTPTVEFNNAFTIHVPPSSISEVDLLVTVCEKSTGLGGKKLVGRTHVGSNCLMDQGLQHWQDMLVSPKSTCAQWHILGAF